MEDEREGITIVRVEAKDYQGLRVAKLESLPNGGLVRVTGANGAGKSSLLKSIAGALGGATEVHARPVHDDSEDGQAWVELTLSNGFRITRKTTESAPKGYLTVVGEDGGKYNQGALDAIVGPFSFDVQSFFSLRADRQREVLLSLGDDPDLGEKLSKVDAEIERLREERRPYNSDIQRIQRMKEPEGERPEPVDVSGEMARLRELQAEERARQDHERSVQQAKDVLERDRTRRDSFSQEVEDLQRRLDEAKANEVEAEERVALSIDAVHEEAAKLADLPDPTADIEAVQARLSEADHVSAILEPWREWSRAQRALGAAKEEADALTSEIDAYEEDKTYMVSSAGIPVPDVSFGPDGEALYKGRPLDLASGSERIRVAVAVAMAANPDLRIALIDEGNDLGLEALEELDRHATDLGFQVWMCRLGIEGPGDIQVEGGVARSTEEGA